MRINRDRVFTVCVMMGQLSFYVKFIVIDKNGTTGLIKKRAKDRKGHFL